MKRPKTINGKSGKHAGSNMHDSILKRSRAGDTRYGRARITNNGELLPGVDGRSVWARRFRDLIRLHTDDRGGDGCSEAEKALIRRAAAIITELEFMEAEFAAQGKAKAWQLHAYQRAANTLRRLLQAVGLKREPKDITPRDDGDIQRLMDHLDRLQAEDVEP